MLDQAEVKLFRTDQSGDITVKSDGKRLSFTTLKVV
jgi:beta-lactamase superfamily II metal-dependent hydrolase